MRRQISVPTILAAAVLAVLAAGAPAYGQEPDADALRRQMKLPRPPGVELAARGPLVAPAIAIGVPTAYGADWGDVFVGVGFQSRTRLRDDVDGGAVAGIGLGDARRLVGLEVAVSQFGTFRSCCRGSLSLKLHRALPSLDASVAVGWENVTGWGSMEGEELFTDGGESFYGAATKVFLLSRTNPFRTLTTTLGVGNGRFRTESDILEDFEEDGIEDNTTVNVFGSAAWRFADRFSAIGSWTGQDLAAGLSVVPLGDVPIVGTVAFTDLTTEPRFIVGLAYGLGFTGTF